MEISLQIVLTLTLVSFIAGFVDAAVGGGGLIQTPIAFILLPTYSVVNIIGSLKIPSLGGTLLAFFTYRKKVYISVSLIFIFGLIAFFSSMLGTYMLTLISNQYFKTILFVVLILIAIYTFFKKEFGQSHKTDIDLFSFKNLVIQTFLVVLIGFYDGFIGPGTGTILLMCYVYFLKFDFMHASLYAKGINVFTNLGSILFFIWKGTIIWSITIPMLLANVCGSYMGSNLALAKGNKYLKSILMYVVTLIIIKFGYDLFLK